MEEQLKVELKVWLDEEIPKPIMLDGHAYTLAIQAFEAGYRACYKNSYSSQT